MCGCRATSAPGSNWFHDKGLGLKRTRVRGPRERRDFKVSRSKARRTGFDRLSGWLDRAAGGNQAIGVNDREPFSIFTALQIERLERVVVGAIDMNHLARI